MALRGEGKLSQVFQIPLVPNLDHTTPNHVGRPSAVPVVPPNHDWRVDDNELAADFDGSLSGLGMDLAGIPYNMRLVWSYYVDTSEDENMQLSLAEAIGQ